MLWALTLLPLLVVAYIFLDRRARHWGRRLGNGAHQRVAIGWRRHALAVWCLLGLAVVLLALTRPRAVLLLQIGRAHV